MLSAIHALGALACPLNILRTPATAWFFCGFIAISALSERHMYRFIQWIVVINTLMILMPGQVIPDTGNDSLIV